MEFRIDRCRYSAACPVMSLQAFEYPGLYKDAGSFSGNSQRYYLRLIAIEYVLLIIAAIFSLELSESSAYFIVYAGIFLMSLGVLIVRNWTKPEQDWYKGRALAESIKTSCWRYCMRAEPFGDVDSVVVRRAEFRNYLRAILESNRHIGGRISPDAAADDQITASMESTRALSLEERRAFYQDYRIKDQRQWYARKAVSNKRASFFWVMGGFFAYFVAIALVLTRIAYPNIIIWPIEPIIVIASSIIGWTQVKKFNELSSSYTLTAHEIGIIQTHLVEIHTEEEFSEFINESEQAFSREHTQWVARQQTPV